MLNFSLIGCVFLGLLLWGYIALKNHVARRDRLEAARKRIADWQASPAGQAYAALPKVRTLKNGTRQRWNDAAGWEQVSE